MCNTYKYAYIIINYINLMCFMYIHTHHMYLGFPSSSAVKNLPANAGDMGLIPGSGRSPRKGNGNPVQYSCLGNPIDRGVWWATPMGSQESDTT